MASKTTKVPPVAAERGGYAQYQIVTLADLDQFRNDLLKEIRYLLNQKSEGVPKKWLKSHEVRRVLQISPGTLQHLRDSGQIPFTKLGGIIYYEFEVINTMMRKQ
ncbi:helix-turn-helix domain-containing protein [Pseudocnuella soli]|uniref:helix-turn-helix domain-containing protein n=1 Tax=Pseudocnuella soli TaxID=2502779 RepID=UPI00195D8ADE|nr:helix-turn-helix domain-containing protein [Pseudocnuella soli]